MIAYASSSLRFSFLARQFTMAPLILFNEASFLFLKSRFDSFLATHCIIFSVATVFKMNARLSLARKFVCFPRKENTLNAVAMGNSLSLTFSSQRLHINRSDWHFRILSKSRRNCFVHTFISKATFKIKILTEMSLDSTSYTRWWLFKIQNLYTWQGVEAFVGCNIQSHFSVTIAFSGLKTKRLLKLLSITTSSAFQTAYKTR